METFAQVTHRVLQSNAQKLADAKTPEERAELADELSAQIRDQYNPQNDRAAYLSVIGILGVVAVIVAITYAVYTLTPDTYAAPGTPISKLRDLPDALIALGSAAIGALAGLLAPSPRT